jgi:hypothetical protein
MTPNCCQPYSEEGCPIPPPWPTPSPSPIPSPSPNPSTGARKAATDTPYANMTYSSNNKNVLFLDPKWREAAKEYYAKQAERNEQREAPGFVRQ